MTSGLDRARIVDVERVPGAALVVEDDARVGTLVARVLRRFFGKVALAESAEEGESLRRERHFDLLVVDVQLPGQSGIDWLRGVRRRDPATPALVMTAHADLDTALAAFRAGANDFLPKPFEHRDLRAAIERLATPLPIASFTSPPIHWTLAEVERHHALRVLERVNGNKSKAARHLGIGRKTLDRRLKVWLSGPEDG